MIENNLKKNKKKRREQKKDKNKTTASISIDLLAVISTLISIIVR